MDRLALQELSDAVDVEPCDFVRDLGEWRFDLSHILLHLPGQLLSRLLHHVHLLPQLGHLRLTLYDVCLALWIRDGWKDKQMVDG